LLDSNETRSLLRAHPRRAFASAASIDTPAGTPQLGAGRVGLPFPPSPLLLTLDVHAHPTLPDVLIDSADTLARHDAGGTYFVPAALVRGDSRVRTALRELKARGHSIGCHGLNHSDDEDLATMPPKAELQLLRDATSILEDVIGSPITAFRAPNFRLSRRTLLFLSELGYKADVSVTPQRIPIFSSSPWSFGWLLAPRSPYHPSERSPYRRGSLAIREIPTSSFVLPLAHGTIANLPSELPTRLLGLLHAEARRFGRTLVVMLHPESLAGAAEQWKPSLKWRDFFPRRNGGIRCRFYFLMESDHRIIQQRTLLFLQRLAMAGMVSASVDEYLMATEFEP